MIIGFNVRGQKLTREDCGFIAGNSLKYLKAVFNLDGEWANSAVVKTAVFATPAGTAYHVLLGSGGCDANEAYVAPEVLREGFFTVGLIGVSGSGNNTVRMTTNTVSVEVSDSGSLEGENTSATASEVEQLTALLAGKENNSNKVSSFRTTPDDTHYPSEKLVKDSIDSLQSQIDDINYKPIAFAGISISPPTAEIGSTIPTVTVNWSLNKAPYAMTLDGVSLADMTQRTATFSNIVANKTVVVTATDTGSHTASPATARATASISFLNSVYYGKGAEFVRADMSSRLSATRAGTITVNAGNDEYIYYAYPSRYGTATFKVGGFEGGFILSSTENVTNASGYTEQFYIYRSYQPNLGNTTVTIS